ncbi:MAG: D-cysteine desulfhydrase family protein [Bacillota bacterium]|nr:D-cysteine desulfhydrase family protein [Bacillota bacterium]
MQTSTFCGRERLQLGAFPTPLQRLDNLSREFGREVWVKRDDMSGVALGGNKVRKLEFLLHDALKNGYDCVITTGGAQSNHAMITAACCNRLGLGAYLVLMGRGVTERRGNLLLNDLLGAQVSFVDSDDFEVVYAAIDALAERLRAAGKKPYIIPLGASVPLGALGYVSCVAEIAAQAQEAGLGVDHIVGCCGSCGTYAGLLVGALRYLPAARVSGIIVGAVSGAEQIAADMARDTAALAGIPFGAEQAAQIRLFDYQGAGYAIPSPAGNRAIGKMAALEGLFLDPVYTGKTFAGLLDLHEQGYFAPGESIVFLHSGGAATLFAIDF